MMKDILQEEKGSGDNGRGGTMVAGMGENIIMTVMVTTATEAMAIMTAAEAMMIMVMGEVMITIMTGIINIKRLLLRGTW